MDYNSEFDSDAEERNRKRRKVIQNEKKPVVTDHIPSHFVSRSAGHSKAHHSSSYLAFDKEEASRHRQQFISLNAFDRHNKLVNDYLKFYGGRKDDLKRDNRFDKTDLDVIRENVKFVYDEEDEESELTDWNQRVAKRYWDKLYKEYAIGDLTYFKTGQIGMRWRTEKEVVSGKGQFVCGNKFCQESEGLCSWEINFSYREGDEKKNTLVKIRLCPDCSFKLNYKKQHKPSKKRKLDKVNFPEEFKNKKQKDKKKKKQKVCSEQNREASSKTPESDLGSPENNVFEKEPVEPNIWVKKAEEEKKSLDEEGNNIDDDIDSYFLDILS